MKFWNRFKEEYVSFWKDSHILLAATAFAIPLICFVAAMALGLVILIRYLVT
mgnify:CR=1 FL=1